VRTDRLQREFDLELRWTVFPLHPEIPEEGIELADLFRGSGFDIGAMTARVKNVAADVGLPLGERTLVCNSRRAQELGKWAESSGKGDEFRREVFHAYFAQGRNIGLPGELEKIAAAAGLPGEDVAAILERRIFAGQVDADWSRAMQLAVTAVPFYLCGEKPLVGFRPYEDFVKLLSGG
jgi:predicted DsbA family dithiol-disulfide isomerase